MTHGSSSAPGAGGSAFAPARRTSRSRRRSPSRLPSCYSPGDRPPAAAHVPRCESCLNRSRHVLTDYHVHLRPDDRDAETSTYHTAANVERYREAAEERGIAELGVSEHIYRFAQALTIWRHPFWETYAHDDLDEYCGFVREQTDLRLGIEADFVPGTEDRTANLLESRDFDYVVGSVHFLREGAVDMDDYSVWDSGRSPEEVWRRYFETIAEAARRGLFDIAAHPDLVKYWGPTHPGPTHPGPTHPGNARRRP